MLNFTVVVISLKLSSRIYVWYITNTIYHFFLIRHCCCMGDTVRRNLTWKVMPSFASTRRLSRQTASGRMGTFIWLSTTTASWPHSLRTRTGQSSPDKGNTTCNMWTRHTTPWHVVWARRVKEWHTWPHVINYDQSMSWQPYWIWSNLIFAGAQ